MPLNVSRVQYSNEAENKHSKTQHDVFDNILKAASADPACFDRDVDFLSLLSTDLSVCEPELGSIVKHRSTEEVGFICGEITLICGHRALKFRPFDSAPTESVTCDPNELVVVGDPDLKVGYPARHKN